jgi:hypothetical protein
MGKAVDFLTPVGRLVQGDCFEAQTKDSAGKPYLDKNNQPTQKYFVAVAFPKNDPAFAQIKVQFEQIARAEFPQLFPNGGPCVNPNFSFKIIDGDGIDNNGKPNSSKEGFAGCWVLRASSSYPPKCFAAGKYAPHEQLHPQAGVNPIPRGHYVRLSGNVTGNGGGNGKPGLYVNVNMIEWARVGDVIVGGPDAASVFGGAPGATPAAPQGRQMLAAAGATTYEAYIAAGWTDAQLIASGFMAAPAVAAPAPTPPAPPAAPAPTPPAPPTPPAAVTPHAGILAGPQMTAAAGATTYAQYIAAGWTDAQLIASGFMVAPAAASVPAPLPPAGSVQPPAPPAPTAPAPAPSTKRMLPAAGATTYEQYIAAGWTDAQLIQNSFMAVA